jgi:hypothetical protein
MASYTGTVDCEHSPSEVFAYLLAFEHTAEWDPSCDRARRLTVGEPGIGSRFELIFKPARSLEFKLDYGVISLDAPRRVTLRSATDLLQSEDTITVQAAGTGSRVTYHAKISLNGPGRLLDPLLALGLRRAGQKAEQGLAQRLRQPL